MCYDFKETTHCIFFLQIHIIPCAISSSILIESAIRYINIEEGHCKGTIVHFIDNSKYFN